MTSTDLTSDRCQFAVNLSIPSRVMKDRVQLMINCINHHSSNSIFDLRMRTVQYLGYPELRTYIGKRLFTCWLDFALKLDRIKEAQPPPAVTDVDTLPENVLDPSASASASAKSSSAAGGGSASASTASASTTTVTSAAETRSAAQPTQATESAPIPTSQPPRTARNASAPQYSSSGPRLASQHQQRLTRTSCGFANPDYTARTSAHSNSPWYLDDSSNC